MRVYVLLLCAAAMLADVLFTTVFVVRGVWQLAISVCLAPFRAVVNTPEVTCVDTDENRLLLERMPSARKFAPWVLAVGPIAQTLASVWFRRMKVPYTREFFTMPDGVLVALDWKAKPDLPEDAPLVFIAHGLGGGSGSHYAEVLTDELHERGYRSVVYNRRGHHGTSLAPQVAGSTSTKVFPQHWDEEDMCSVVDHVVNCFPAATKFAIGFSCGANIVANFQALRKDASPFMAAASLGNGYDLVSGTKYLADEFWADGFVASFLKSKLYTNGLLTEAMELAKQANIQVNWTDVMCCISLRAFEKALVVPVYGYKHEDDYYHFNTCHWRLKDVCKPLLCVANWDDPLVDRKLPLFAVSAAAANPSIITVVTQHGGHIGWVTGRTELRWWIRLYLEFITAVQAKA
ncbi:Abhydrolase domain-containing protein [Tetrabaena socialis]|uniref:Abhydrolase domain-containing protein n=1 Tax=Tetrabaena socialis TaxID=47790 RepID=A0A2J8A1Q6_9CHLO|nr:Abhydrolase domain-containing protein [Tetrabaena socialis]|eukprot:PNH06452.1 Abhydrolase domain-containing protein [Tetrabaena socialis]